nr:PREDICTED: uncharacterized protein LOC106493085 [Apteryx mantelli mantelli]
MDQNDGTDSDTAGSSSTFRPKWLQIYNAAYVETGPGNTPKQLAASEWFLKPRHLVKSLGDYPALTNLSLPVFSVSAVSHVAGLLESETTSKNDLLSEDLVNTNSFPVKLGAPHVIGVESLLHPKVPVRTCSHERVSSFLDQGSSLSVEHAGNYRSRSFSPASKKSRWLRSRSQSPKSIWRPNSAKASACAQPLPNFGRFRYSRKTTASTRQSRSRKHKMGSLAARSHTSTRMNAGGILSSSWSPYSLPSATMSSPAAQDIYERYEMRSSQFHYEAHKNNELLRGSQDLQSLCNYR